jgi:7-carboxy-7-deazaguanine synthase
MLTNEIFYSLQGEGRLVGVPSVFIRLAGCPLRCRWCDTKFAWDETDGKDYSIEEIIQTIQKWPCQYVVVTGGEPMVSLDLPQLLSQLKAAERHITIETSGIAYVPDLPCDLMSISPKLSNSTPTETEFAEAHENSRLDLAVLRELIGHYEYQLKFVVESQDDLAEIQQTIEKIGNVNRDKVMLMPQAATRQEFLDKADMVVDMCRQSGFTFCLRLQILLWNYQKDI